MSQQLERASWKANENCIFIHINQDPGKSNGKEELRLEWELSSKFQIEGLTRLYFSQFFGSYCPCRSESNDCNSLVFQWFWSHSCREISRWEPSKTKDIEVERQDAKAPVSPVLSRSDRSDQSIILRAVVNQFRWLWNECYFQQLQKRTEPHPTSLPSFIQIPPFPTLFPILSSFSPLL